MIKQPSYTPLLKPIAIKDHKWPEGTIPLLHTRTMTFNHVDYIKDCIEGILMQKTTFPVEILIHDDASSDKTIDVLKYYESLYPKIIRVFYQKENSYSKPDKHERRQTFMSWRRGKYEAMCEGDDYWIDTLKLQKQIDFLENNNDFSMSAHRHNVLKGNEMMGVFPREKLNKKYLLLEDLIKEVPFQTASVVYRSKFFPDLAKNKWGSHFLFMILAKNGKVHYLNDIMSVRRMHSGGVWAGGSVIDNERLELPSIKARIEYFKEYSNNKAISKLKDYYVKRCFFYFTHRLLRFEIGAAMKLFISGFKYGLRLTHLTVLLPNFKVLVIGILKAVKNLFKNKQSLL